MLSSTYACQHTLAVAAGAALQKWTDLQLFSLAIRQYLAHCASSARLRSTLQHGHKYGRSRMGKVVGGVVAKLRSGGSLSSKDRRTTALFANRGCAAGRQAVRAAWFARVGVTEI